MVRGTFSLSFSPVRMQSYTLRIVRITVGVLLSTVLVGSIAYAQNVLSAEMLERDLISMKRQWTENERKYHADQKKLEEDANTLRAQLCTAGRRRYCPGVDIKKLARAVAVAETQNCTTGVGATRNNCFGIKGVEDGVYQFRTFATPEASYEEFERIWLRAYGDRFPTIADARRWTASDGQQWLGIVATVYHRR